MGKGVKRAACVAKGKCMSNVPSRVKKTQQEQNPTNQAEELYQQLG